MSWRSDVSDTPAIVFRTPSGLTISLTADEYRLALLGLVDFAGAWDALALAADFVVDGPAKQALIRERLRPLSEALSPLAQQVDALAMLAARHWFRTGQTSEALSPEAAP
jgi:hypothetical protein